MKLSAGALAFAFLSLGSCTTLPPMPVDRAEAFVTPSAGNLMILARHGTGFETVLDRDYRICNTGPAFALTVYWNLPDSEDPQSPERQSQALPSGSCIELGAAKSIELQNGAPHGVALSGYTERYLRGTFPSGFRLGPVRPVVPPPRPPGVAPENGEWLPLECRPIGASSPNDGYTFVRECPIPILGRGDYRMCFDDKYVVRTDGGTVWPPGLIATVVDRQLVTRPMPDPENPRWNWVIEKSCRDYEEIREASVLIRGDANYDAKKVLAVRLNLTPIH
jgi:hypothetical protein